MPDKDSKLPAHLRPPTWKPPRDRRTYSDPTPDAAIRRLERGQ
ncbi:hypothetical protein DFO65_103324 [Brevibacterium celere]|uniref:Uncharacterized protein n=1 Tax=Brevibacterium celere TaxID=225845 RepID=A0A366INW1_9MICO|nr:hypothetical protein DFO65_103324 [Brevibacterium celere]